MSYQLVDQILNEKAPPGKKYKRMVKHIAKSVKGKKSKTGLPYAVAWKQYNKDHGK